MQKLRHGKKSKSRVLTCKVLIGPHGLLKKKEKRVKLLSQTACSEFI